MTKLIYVDTNIYLDYFDGRKDNLRPFGEFAYQMLKRTLQCEFRIVISGLVLKELFYNSYEEKTNKLLPDFYSKNKIIKIPADKKDVKKARDLCRQRRTSFNDTLHAVLACKANADFLVTRNLKDFYDLQDIIKLKCPENL